MGELDKRIEELEEENRYLKDLLKQHGVSFERPKRIAHHDYSSGEKIALFLTYFVGRDDIFAYQYITKEGKKSFSPACRNRPHLTGYCPDKCSVCARKQYLGLTEVEAMRHLTGNDTFGIYPLLQGDMCKLLAVDFDDADYKDSAIGFYKVCKRNGIDCIIEISSSGSGAHVWMFFDRLIPASKARKLGSYLLYEAMDDCRGVRFESLDRMFPSQDYVPSKGYGNLIVLPLQGKKALEGKTVFVDENFVPYDLKHQIDALSSVKRISEEEIDLLLKTYKEKDQFPSFAKDVLKGIRLTKADFPREIVIIKDAEIIVPKAGLSNQAMKFLYRLGSLPNIAYYEAQRQRRSVFSINRILRLYREDEDYLYLPRGIFESLMKVFAHYGVAVDLRDKQAAGKLISVTFKGSLYPVQKEGLEELVKYENGLFVAPPSFGKTVTAIALIERLKLNALVIVPTLTLLRQWVHRLEEFLEVGYETPKKYKFGEYHGAKKKLTGMIDVASIDSLMSEEGKAILGNYGLIIIDEAHHIGAYSYETVARNCRSKYLYGFTATSKRSDKNERIVYRMIGDIRFQYDKHEEELQRILRPEFTFFTYSSFEKTTPYADMVRTLLTDKERNARIIDDIKKSLLEKRNILVLTDRIEHISLLKEGLLDTPNVFVANGSLNATQRKDFLLSIDNVEDGFVILATGKFIGEGFDEKRLDTLFLVSPFRWNGTLQQYAGRIHRKNKGKDQAIVHDYIDLNVRMFARMYHERLRGYRALGYVIDGEHAKYEREIFDTLHYRSKLMDDITNAKRSVSFIVGSQRCEELLDMVKLAKQCIIYSKHPIAIDNRVASSVCLVETEINAIVIDERILWYGSVNPYISSNGFSDSIMRIDDRSIAERFLKEIAKKP